MTIKKNQNIIKSPNISFSELRNSQIKVDNQKIVKELFEDKKLVSTLKKLSLV